MFIVEEKPKSVASENYRVLRTNIQYSSFDKEIKSIVITSSVPGEGKSTTAGNLALSFAQTSQKTIIIDCDLRKPTLHKKFNVSNQYGLSDVLVGNTSLENALSKYNDYLDVLTSGKIPPNPSEMLGSKTMENLLAYLKDNYNYVILDTAPLRAVTDAQILSTKVDGIILVVKAESTKKEAMLQAKGLLENVKANILGTVLNGVENSRSKYYYYYGNE